MVEVRKLLGANIRDLRKERGWTQKKLAELIGISPTFIMHIERGNRGVSLDTIGLFAKVLHVEISRLFESINEDEDLSNIVLPPELILERELKTKINNAITQYISEMKNHWLVSSD